MSREARHVYSRKYTEPRGAREERRRSAELRAEEMSRMTGLDLYLDSDEGPGQRGEAGCGEGQGGG